MESIRGCRFTLSIIVALSANLVIVTSLDGDPYKGFKSPCGTATQIAQRARVCLDGVLDVMDGKVPKPQNDQDLVLLCDRFATTEKCIRTLTKDCLSGIHRTTVGSVASASKKFRAQECKTPAVRAKYAEAVGCTEKRGKDIIKLFQNDTAILQAIRDDPKIQSGEKMMKTCCLWDEMDKEVERLLKPTCPNSVPVILNIIHAMTDEAKSVICLRPKCQNVIKPYIGSKYEPPQRFIEPILQTLFMLSGDN